MSELLGLGRGRRSAALSRLRAIDFPRATPLRAFFEWNEKRRLQDRRFRVACDIYELFIRFGGNFEARCVCVAHLAINPVILWRWRQHLGISSRHAAAAGGSVERMAEAPAVAAAWQVVESLLASIGSRDLAVHVAVFRAFDALEAVVDIGALARLRPRKKASVPRASPQNILVIKLSALGDFIQALGPAAAIRRHHANDRITLLTTRPFVELAEQTGLFHDIVVDRRPKLWNILGWLRLRRLLRGAGYRRVYDLQTSNRSSSYCWLFPLRDRPQWSGIAWRCSHPHANLDRYPQHTLDKQAEQLLMAGIYPVPMPTCPVIARSLPAELNQERFVLLIPGSSPRHLDKRWPITHYAEVGRRLTAAGYLPVVIGTHNERDIGAAIRENCSSAVDLVGATDLLMLAQLAQRAALTIGNDTGATHMAAAGGNPVLVLFSRASDPSRCAPRGEFVRVITVADLGNLSADTVFTAALEIVCAFEEKIMG